VGTTIERGKGNMSDMRSTSRIKEIEKGYGDNEEKKPELEDGEDGDEVSAFLQDQLTTERND